MMDRGSPSSVLSFTPPAGMVIISETELAAIRAEITDVRSFSEETRAKLETMRTEVAGFQQTTASNLANNTAADSTDTSPSIAMSAPTRKKRDTDITVSIFLQRSRNDATHDSHLRGLCTANPSIFSVNVSLP